MKLLKRIFGICETGKPGDDACWRYAGGKVYLDLSKAEEISRPGGAMRLEGKGLPCRVLLFRGLDKGYYALENKCTHIGGRRIDPRVEDDRLKCCSVMGSVFKYNGEVVSGPARKPLTMLEVVSRENELLVDIP